MSRVFSLAVWVVVTLVFAFLTPQASHATMLAPISLEDVTDIADVIVAGTVIQSEGRYDPHFDLVFTHVTVRVEEVLEGSAEQQTVEVVVPGGIDGDLWSQVHGAPEAGDDGQQVVVFLYANRGAYMSNVVYWQGLYHIDADKIRETGEPAGLFIERVRDMVLKQRLRNEDPFGSSERDNEGREVQR